MHIVIGCPIKDRAWALPHWIEGIRAQEMEMEIKVVCLYSKSEDTTVDLLYEYGATVIEDNEEGRNGWQIDNHSWGQMDQYEYMSRIRNRLLEIVISSGADYFFSLDSDIVIPPGCLQTLIEDVDRNGGMASPYVNMSWGTKAPNVMRWDDPYHPDRANRIALPQSGAYVDAIMAAILMDRKGMEARWSAHPQGEDLGLCLNAHYQSIPRYWNPTVQCDHMMIKY